MKLKALVAGMMLAAAGTCALASDQTVAFSGTVASFDSMGGHSRGSPGKRSPASVLA